MSRPWSAHALRPEAGPGAWLLELTLGGTTYYVADVERDVLKADGESVHYRAGLTIGGYEQLLAAQGDVGGELSVALEADVGVSVALLVQSRGVDLSAGSGELSYLPGDADTYEERLLALLGVVDEPEYGAPDQPLEVLVFSLRQAIPDDAGLIPDPSMRITDAAFSAFVMPESAKEVQMPFVFGFPGAFVELDGTGVTLGATPGTRIEGALDFRIVIAGHHVQAAFVEVFDSDLQSQIRPVTNDYDDYGRPYAWIERDVGAPLNVAEPTYWIAWYPGVGGSGIATPYAAAASLAGAGSLIRYLLSQASIPTDDRSIAGAAAWLDNRFQLGGYGDSAQSPWDFLRDEIAPLLPIALVPGQSGMRVVIWRPGATAADAAEHLVEGSGCFLQSSISYDRKRGDVINKVTLEYAIDGRTGDPRRVITLTPDPDPANPAEWSTDHARVSAARYRTHATTLSSSYVWGDKTAALICEMYVVFHGFVWRVLVVAVDRMRSWVQPGMVVTYTNADLFLEDQPCIVSNWARDEGGAILTLTICEDPVRDRRSI